MNIDIRDIIKLSDNNEYGVVSKITHDNKIYYYLVNINDNSKIKFCYENKNELVELENKKIIQTIIPKLCYVEFPKALIYHTYRYLQNQ